MIPNMTDESKSSIDVICLESRAQEAPHDTSNIFDCSRLLETKYVFFYPIKLGAFKITVKPKVFATGNARQIKIIIKGL